jgi:hypothetical protein
MVLFKGNPASLLNLGFHALIREVIRFAGNPPLYKEFSE